MYKVVSMERLGDSVFRTEYITNTLQDAKNIYNKEKDKENIVDIRLWLYTELGRFVKRTNKNK